MAEGIDADFFEGAWSELLSSVVWSNRTATIQLIPPQHRILLSDPRRW